MSLRCHSSQLAAKLGRGFDHARSHSTDMHTSPGWFNAFVARRNIFRSLFVLLPPLQSADEAQVHIFGGQMSLDRSPIIKSENLCGRKMLDFGAVEKASDGD